MSRRAAFCLVSMLCTFFLVLGFAVVSFAEETVDAPPASSVEAAATAGASSSNEDDVLLIEEPAEEGEVGGEGRAPEPSALASESIDSEAIDWIDFLFIETPEMALGGTERIAIGFTDSQVIGSASIEVADSNGTTWDVSAKTIEDGAALFEIGQDLGLTDGEYRIAAVTFEADGETRVVDLSDESASAVFAVMGQSDARSLSLDDMVSTTFVSADNDDQITSSGSIESVLGSLQSYGLKSRSAESVAKPTVVVLDAGHGGLDSGTVANGIIESNVTLKIAKYCRQELESRGYSVVMTRSDDSYVALEDRAEIARNAGAGLFVSFHINQGGGQGVEVWIPAKSTWYSSFHEFGETLGNKILAKLEALGFDSRGLISDYYSNNPDGSAGDYLSVIRNCRKYGIPAVLIEHGFIDNYHDVTYLKNEANLKKIGIADAEAIASVTLPGGLIEDGEGLRFLQSDGTYLCSAWKEWEGKTYYFDEDGYALVHRQTIGGKRYYFNARGELQTGWVVWVDGSGRSYYGGVGTGALSGWQEIGGERYYLDPEDVDHRAYRWEKTVGGKRYYFSAEGAMHTGWLTWKADGRRSYFSQDGPAVTGWQEIGGERYYFSGKDCRALRYRQTIDGERYYFNGSDSSMHTGLLTWKADGRRSYYASDGTVVTGWKTVAGETYYFDPDDVDGKSLVHRQTIGGKRYYFNARGELQTGWVVWVDGSGRSYYGGVGTGALSGWQEIGGERYYLDPEDVDHRAYRWEKTVGGKRYYFSAEGVMHTGWLQWKADGKWSYFGSDGVMYTGTRTINGVTYKFDNNGRTDLDPVQAKMVSKARSYSSATKWLIMVDTKNNYLGIFTGKKGSWSLHDYWICSTGATYTPTVLGQYSVTGKGYSFGHGYTCYYYTQFYGDYLIHSVKYYQGTFSIMDGRMGMNISEGCVRLPLNRAKWIYDNIPYGTKVVTYR